MDLLMNIDGKATQEAVEKQLRQFRTYKLTTPEDLLPTITPKYTIEMPAFTGAVNSKTENAAIKAVDQYREAEKFFAKFHFAFRKLSRKEREIIVKSYLEEYPNYNYAIARELHVAERTFYRMKSKALYTLAIALGVAVFEEEEEKSS